MYLFPIRVYYEDTDAGGVVYHAAYLGFAERARTEALREAGASHAALQAEHGLSFMVRRIGMRYLRPARLDDLLQVRTRALRLGGASAELEQRIYRGDELLVAAEVGLACVRNDGRPARVPERWRLALAAGAGGPGMSGRA